MAVRSAKGSVFQIGGVSSPTDWDTLGQLRAYTQSGPKLTVQDITTHSTAGNWMEKLATLIEPGTISGPINYDSADATHQFATGIWADLIALTDRASRIVFPAGIGRLTFNHGYFTSHAFDMPTDNVLQANFEYTISGAITATNT